MGQYIKPISTSYLNLSGGTVTGTTVFTQSLSALTFHGDGSNLTGIHDYFTTGGTYEDGTVTFYRNDGNFYSISGFYTGNTSPEEIIYFDSIDPNLIGTIFDPDVQLDSNMLYVSIINSSTWTSNGVSYQTYTGTTMPTTPFYLDGTSVDAGGNKTATIQRVGGVHIGTGITNVNYAFQIDNKDALINGITVGRGGGNYLRNTALGYRALSANTITGVAPNRGSNVAVGYLSLYKSIGEYNVSIGDNSGANLIDGGANVFVGKSAAITLTGGTGNVNVGNQSMYYNVNGDFNISLGRNSLFSLTGGSYNLALGYYAGAYTQNSNEFYLDNQNRVNSIGEKSKGLMYGQFNSTLSNQKLYLNAGNVGISMSGNTATAKLHIHEPSGANNYIKITNSDTGTAAGDGFDIGITTLEKAIVWNYEPTSLAFATNNLERLTITSAGTITNTAAGYSFPTTSGNTDEILRKGINNTSYWSLNYWSGITNIPTSVSGYGITDVYTKNENNSIFVKKSGDTITGAILINNTLVVTGVTTLDMFSATQMTLGGTKIITKNNIILSGDVLNGGSW